MTSTCSFSNLLVCTFLGIGVVYSLTQPELSQLTEEQQEVVLGEAKTEASWADGTYKLGTCAQKRDGFRVCFCDSSDKESPNSIAVTKIGMETADKNQEGTVTVPSNLGKSCAGPHGAIKVPLKKKDGKLSGCFYGAGFADDSKGISTMNVLIMVERVGDTIKVKHTFDLTSKGACAHANGSKHPFVQTVTIILSVVFILIV